MNSETQVTRYPFDYHTIEKGDCIKPSVCEEKTGKRRGTTEYQFALMALSKKVEADMLDEGRPVTVRVHKDGLRILTDIEASRFNHDCVKSYLLRMGYSAQRLARVDFSQFDDHDKLVHAHRVQIAAATVRGAKKERNNIFRVIAHQKPEEIPYLAESAGDEEPEDHDTETPDSVSV